MGSVIGNRMATLHELQTVYDTEDMLLIHEAGAVVAFNNRPE